MAGSSGIGHKRVPQFEIKPFAAGQNIQTSHILARLVESEP
jgi:hypothetical protein